MLNTARRPGPFAAQRIAQLLQVVNWLSDRCGRSVPSIVDMDYLRSLPAESFGYAWARHLDANHLQPLDQGPRRQQLHDGVHVLTDYGTDPVGEAEVQAFLLGAKFHIANLLILGGILRGLHQERHHFSVLDASTVNLRLKAAYRRGQCAQFDPYRWQPEGLWECPLPVVRAQFGLAA
ncbi:MAG: hypothetical protein ACFBSG_15095 [Leptolyngbyaceae cyanobacterium]